MLILSHIYVLCTSRNTSTVYEVWNIEFKRVFGVNFSLSRLFCMKVFIT